MFFFFVFFLPRQFLPFTFANASLRGRSSLAILEKSLRATPPLFFMPNYVFPFPPPFSSLILHAPAGGKSPTCSGKKVCIHICNILWIKGTLSKNRVQHRGSDCSISECVHMHVHLRRYTCVKQHPVTSRLFCKIHLVPGLSTILLFLSPFRYVSLSNSSSVYMTFRSLCANRHVSTRKVNLHAKSKRFCREIQSQLSHDTPLYPLPVLKMLIELCD